MSADTRNAVRIVLLYGLASIVWLALSDYLLPYLIEEPAQLAKWQLMSGYFWLAISAVLIFRARSRLLRYLRIGLGNRR